MEKTLSHKIDLKKLMEATDLLKLISNPNRLAILCHLVDNEHSVGELIDLVGLSQSALSQHLAKLREHELVTTRKEGQFVYYSVASKEVKAVLKTLQSQYCKA